MSTQFDKTNTGTLSLNEEKTSANPKWPDYKGSVNIDGKWYWLSGWERNGANGAFLSLVVKPKEAAPAPYADSQAPKPSFRRAPAPTQAPRAEQPKPIEAKTEDNLPF